MFLDVAGPLLLQKSPPDATGVGARSDVLLVLLSDISGVVMAARDEAVEPGADTVASGATDWLCCMTRREAVLSHLPTAASRSSFICRKAARTLSDGSQATITYRTNMR